AVDEPGATSARAVFDIKPGRLRLRMSIQDVTSRVLDLDVRDLAIRDLKGDVAIATPEVLRARNAREFRTLDAETAVPVASREFSRTERLLIRFHAYGPPGAAPAVSAKLLSRMGQAMRDLPIEPAATTGGEDAIDDGGQRAFEHAGPAGTHHECAEDRLPDAAEAAVHELEARAGRGRMQRPLDDRVDLVAPPRVREAAGRLEPRDLAVDDAAPAARL